jgi:hypothetical protein
MKPLIAVLLVAFLLPLCARAVKVDHPNEAEQNATHILSGTVTAIYSKSSRNGNYETQHCLAEVRVEGIHRGDGIKPGQLVYVRYIGAIRWTGGGAPPPGAGPHENAPNEGDRRRICLVQQSDGALEVYYVSGFKTPEAKQP